MKCKLIMNWLETQYPVSYAESWDNVGLLVGREEKKVERVFLALDLTEDTLAQAVEMGADLIITHHPLLFSPVKKINSSSVTGRRILTLIQKDISYYAMHTNYDIMGMAELSAGYLNLQDTRVLSVSAASSDKTEGFGRVGMLPREMTLRECARYVKERLSLKEVKVYGELNQKVCRAAICTGAGKSMIGEALAAGAQVYVTGDIDHHTGIDTVAEGMALIDAGHYGTEYIFMEAVKRALSGAFPELEVTAAEVKIPYTVL